MYSSQPCARLLVGVSGSINATQIVDYLVRIRREFAAEIRVIMTGTAARITPPHVVEQVIDLPVVTDLWETGHGKAPHVRLTSWAEVFVIVPATANIMAKAAAGIADEVLSTAILASPQPVVFAPAMNPVMWQAKAVRRNVAALRADGHYVIDPVPGVSLTTGQFDTGMVTAPNVLLQHLWHVQMRRLRAGYWAEATAASPATPAAAKQLPLVQITHAPARPDADSPATADTAEVATVVTPT